MNNNLDAVTWDQPEVPDDLNNCCIVDGGKRQHFDTGAQREPCDGKGSYELISPFFLKELAIVLEKGAKKYNARNWEKGMPLSRYVNSALRHINQELIGMTDENHMAQAAFNIMAFIHTRKMIAECVVSEDLDDMPKYNQKRNTKMNQDVVDAEKLKREVREDTIESVISYLRHLAYTESSVDAPLISFIIQKLGEKEPSFWEKTR